LPSAAPWQDSLRCLFGAPKPMMVLQQISVGLSGSIAAETSAALIA